MMRAISARHLERIAPSPFDLHGMRRSVVRFERNFARKVGKNRPE